MIKKIILVLICTICISGCERVFYNEPENNPTEVFNTLWQIYDLKYPAFEVKNVDWDSAYLVTKPKINNSLNDNELFTVLSEMLSCLKDQHVWLKGFKMYCYQKSINFYYNKNVIDKYLTSAKNFGVFNYGKLGEKIGYFHIITFSSTENSYGYIDNILSEFGNCTGIVIDIRSNAGGDSNNADLIASRFYDKERAYGYDVYRNGSSHNDYTKAFYSYVSPSDNAKPNLKIVLLTDNSVGSSGESFTLMIHVLPQTTVIGTNTNGNPGGTPNSYELPNGWICYVPTSLQYSMDNSLVYHSIKPDIFVTGKVAGKDLMIEKAIELLNQ
jgi:carboxyl-terminal processing protease